MKHYIQNQQQQQRMNSSHVQIKISETNPNRTHSALPVQRQVRTNATFSTHAALSHNKLLPNTSYLKTKNNNSLEHRSQSAHISKSNDKTLLRYRKLDLTMGESSLTSNPLKEYKRQTMRSKVRANINARDEMLRKFYDKVQELQIDFVRHSHEADYDQASQVIIKLLNYAVDFNLPEQMLRSLKILAEINLLTDKIGRAFFYFDQTREACLLLSHNQLLVQALLGMAQCCGRSGAEQDGIKILKKALSYSWMYNLDELQLRIYDQIGKMHYHLGDLQKAKQYHSRHINALHEPTTSALRQLSNQRVTKAEEIHLQMKYNEITILLLVHLKAPIKNIEQLPLPFPTPPDYDPVRSHFNISSKYFLTEDAPTAARTLLDQNWFFRDEIDDPSLPEHDQNSSKPKKFAFLDFQLNQQLRKLQAVPQKLKRKNYARSQFPVKQSLQEQIARKIKEPPLQSNWYEKLIKQINRDHRNKLLNVRDAVRIRGFNRKVVPPVQGLRDLYNSFFERWKHFGSMESRFASETR